MQSPDRSPSQIRIHSFFPPEPSESKSKIPLAELKKFLEQKEIAGLHVGDIVGGPSPQKICFPSTDMIKKICEKNEADEKKCFQELMDDVRFCIRFYLEIQLDIYFEDRYDFKPVKFLMDEPLYQFLDDASKKLATQLKQKLSDNMVFKLRCGKIDPVKKLINEDAPVKSTLLWDYLYGRVYNWTCLEPGFLQKLIDKNCDVNVKGTNSPLMLLFMPRYDKKNLAIVKEAAKILIAAKADIDVVYQGRTAYDLASESGYPNEILDLVRTNDAYRCRLC